MSLKTDAEKEIDLNIVRYSQCWEDPACLYEALSIGPDDDVLSITSGGCGYSQRSVADHLGIHFTSVSRIVRQNQTDKRRPRK